ncbi:hypothetical protein ACET3Z_011011 [Daucus carota]
MDDVRFSFDEARASWDTYLIARTIPRLMLMFSGIENMILSRPEEQMGSIKEDEKDDMASGLSGEEAKVTVNSNSFGESKLVITLKELKDCHLNSIKSDQPRKSFDSVHKNGSIDALIGFKKLTKWKMAGKW